MTATMSAVLNRAASQVGGYFPHNSPYGVWYDDAVGGGRNIYDAAQFCAMGLSWVFAHENASDIFPLHAYTPSGVQAFKDRGQWHEGTRGIQAGDVLFFNFPGAPNRVSHTGLAIGPWKNGVDTIEFNTSSTAAGSQRNGRTVARKRRTSSIVGYGRPAYHVPGAPTPPPAATGKRQYGILPAMSKGSKTGLEDDWQRVLQGLGYRIKVDGSYGPDTVRITKNFQAARGLTVDGAAGPVTVSASLLSDGDRVLSRGDTGPDVVLLQLIVGVNPDGSFGPTTEAAVKAVQRGAGLDDDGICGPLFVQGYRKAAA